MNTAQNIQEDLRYVVRNRGPQKKLTANVTAYDTSQQALGGRRLSQRTSQAFLKTNPANPLGGIMKNDRPELQGDQADETDRLQQGPESNTREGYVGGPLSSRTRRGYGFAELGGLEFKVKGLGILRACCRLPSHSVMPKAIAVLSVVEAWHVVCQSSKSRSLPTEKIQPAFDVIGEFIT